MANHQKHPKMVRPEFGRYGRNEWAIHGSNCSNIQALVKELIPILSEKFRLGYIDTDHRSFKEEMSSEYLDKGASFSLSDKQAFQSFEKEVDNPDFSYKILLQDLDLTLLNGNHHTGKKQLVFLDETKIESLERNKNKLTNIQAFISKDSYNVVPTHVIEENPGYQDLPVFDEHDIEGIAKFLAQNLQNSTPQIKALVLAGGKSTRMGEDKAAIDYHGKSQTEYMADLLSESIDNVYISARPDQEIDSNYPAIFDRIEGMGPYGGILSAFLSDPNSAWLVVACDLPFVDKKTIEQLIASRDSRKMATAFQSPKNEFPEPLITIWEPKSYMRLLEFMALGYSCPRKVLINSDINLLEANSKEALMNVNTPEELAEARAKIRAKS